LNPATAQRQPLFERHPLSRESAGPCRAPKEPKQFTQTPRATFHISEGASTTLTYNLNGMQYMAFKS